MMIKQQLLGVCKIYISEARNRGALEAIEMAATAFPEAPIFNKFEDVAYNRVGYTLVSQIPPNPTSSSPLIPAVYRIIQSAYREIDLRSHCGTHPRLGVVDHVCFFPLLGGASLDHVALAAKSLAAHVAASLQVATFLYGAAHSQGRSLDSLRRDLGYFKPNAAGNEWAGGPESVALPLAPDEGPPHALKDKGVIVIGATPWVDNYNVPIFTDDMAKAQKIGRRVSGRGGGFESVQCLTLRHSKGMIEVACNLLDSGKVGGDDVQKVVERLAGEEGLEVGQGYYTDFSQEKMVERYLNLVKGASVN